MEGILKTIRSLAVEDDGSEVVEYALIIVLVSIVLAGALSAAGTGIGSSFAALVTRLTTCFTGPTCT